MDLSNNTSNNFFDKIKTILFKIPYMYYIIFFIVIMCIYIYINSGLHILNKMSSKNIVDNKMNDENDIIFKNDLVRLKYKDLSKILGDPRLIETKRRLYYRICYMET